MKSDGKDSAVENSDDPSIATNYYKSAAFVFLSQAAGVTFGFLYQLFLSRTLGEAGYGAFAVFLSAGAVFALFPVLGMDAGLIRFVSKEGNPSVQKWYLSASLKTSLVLTLLLAVVLFLIKDYMLMLFKLQQSIYLYLIIWVVFLCIGKVFDGFLRGISKTTAQSLISVLLANGLKLLLSLLVFLYSHSLASAVIVLVTTEAILLLPRFALLYKHLFQVKPEKQRYNTYKSYLIYCVSLFIYASLSVTMQNVNSLMLNAYLGADQQSQVGVYRVITSYSNVIMVFSTPLMALWPVMSQLYSQGKMDLLEKLYGRSTLAVSLLMVPALIVLSVCSNEFISFFGYKQSIQGSALLMSLLLSANLFDGMVGPAGAMLNMTNHSKACVINNALYCILNVILNTLLIPLYGLLGVAVSASISLVFINSLNVIQSKRLLGIFPYSTNHIIIVACGVLSFAVSWFVKSVVHVSEITDILIIVSVTVALFYGSVYIVMHKELVKVVSLFQDIIKRKKP